MGSKKGLMSFVKKKRKHFGCLLSSPQINLATTEVQEDLAIVFKEFASVVKYIYIKSRPLHTCLFRILCNEMGAEHGGHPFHSKICWLSRGKLLERVANLRHETRTFLKEQNHEHADRFSDDECS